VWCAAPVGLGVGPARCYSMHSRPFATAMRSSQKKTSCVRLLLIADPHGGVTRPTHMWLRSLSKRARVDRDATVYGAHSLAPRLRYPPRTSTTAPVYMSYAGVCARRG
jgi:hypothetical protein